MTAAPEREVLHVALSPGFGLGVACKLMTVSTPLQAETWGCGGLTRSFCSLSFVPFSVGLDAHCLILFYSIAAPMTF